MGNLAIRVEGLGKRYFISNERQAAYQTLGETISSTLLAPARRVKRLVRGGHNALLNREQEMWALQDVSFDIDHGEVVGIIGRNGAGKSTLLKILSRITEPTLGWADIYGRIGALLEVGTGFHPELSGRENIYLNGSILGMRRHEIDRKLDEIIDFSGVEKFIDTPVKHYSSGMGLRLGFAVAAHLDPEIMVVDEVLAVGDAEFQKKCIGKMQTVAEEGRTVLFVSHNMSAINQLCPRCILLRDGHVVMDGATDEVIGEYLKSDSDATYGYEEPLDPERAGQFLHVGLYTTDGEIIGGDHDYSHPFVVRMHIHVRQAQPNGFITVSMRDVYGTPFMFTDLRDGHQHGLPAGHSVYMVEVPGGLLAPRTALITTHLGSGYEALHTLHNVLSLQLHDFDSPRGAKRIGYIGTKMHWSREDAAVVQKESWA